MTFAVLFALSLCYLTGLAVLLWVAYSRRFFHRYTLCKTLLSTGFVVIACVRHGLQGEEPLFFAGLLPCLLLCLAGDVLLGLANTRAAFFSRWFSLGVAAFTLAHVGFCLLFWRSAPDGPGFAWYWAALPLATLAAAAFCARRRQFVKLRRMHLTVPALVYAFVVGLMCACALYFGAARGFDAKGLLAAVGAALFLLSDFVLLFLYFYAKPRKALRALNLSLYYLGLLLLALCV